MSGLDPADMAKLPWAMSNGTLGEAMLWRTGESSFRIIETGPMPEMLTNTDYILIKNKYQQSLEDLEDQVFLTPVEIIDHVRGLRWDDFLEIKIRQEISPNTIWLVNLDELKIWQYGESIFVSDALKKRLEVLGKDVFNFKEGFSFFCA